MAALHRLDYFQNFQIRLHALCRGAILLHPANFCVNRTTRTSNMTEIWFSKWRLCDVMKLWNFDFWSHDHHRNQHSHQQTKFYQNRMNCGWDIPIWPSSKWRPSVIMNFRNSLMWPLSVCDSASWIHIWHWSVNIVLRYGRKKWFFRWRPFFRFVKFLYHPKISRFLVTWSSSESVFASAYHFHRHRMIVTEIQQWACYNGNIGSRPDDSGLSGTTFFISDPNLTVHV